MVSMHLLSVIRALCSDLEIDPVSEKYILRRYQSEGIKFLTESLPRVSKAVISSLELGSFNRETIKDFRYRGATLVFLQSLLNRIFCCKTGVILMTPDPEAIRRIRQLCEYFYKLTISLDKEKENEAVDSFCKNEQELKCISRDPAYISYANLLRKDFETYYSEISSATPSQIFQAHPPRKTSGTYVNSSSMYFLHRNSTNSRTYPGNLRAYSGFFKPYSGVSPKFIKNKPVEEPNYSELLLVPKDSRGPRTICRETLKRLEAQMAYFDFMVSKLTKISNGAINFLDQEVNRNLARSSSVDRKFATLDLKDASDRVSHKLVSEIFRYSSGCSFFVNNVRASFVKVGDSYSRLYKLSGMGSGLTFPTMSLLASLAICHEVKKRFNLGYTYIRKNVFIYGDDIIVPVEWYNFALLGLSKVGLKVNVSKSFQRSLFRESCGADFFSGFDVSITRLKLSNSGVEVSESDHSLKFTNYEQSILQIYEHSKECYKSGLINLSKYYVKILRPTGLLIPGCMVDEPYLVDYHSGTSHLAYDRDYPVYTIVAKAMSDIDTRIIYDDHYGRLERDPYIYLSGFLKRSSRNEGAYRSESPAIVASEPSDFSVLTIPRTARISRKLVPGWILKEPTTLSRQDFLVRHKVRIYTTFISAFMQVQC